MMAVLLVSFQFPPIQGSSGYQRVLSFARYLPHYGWDSTVLTVHPHAFENIDKDNVSLIPRSTKILRAYALDSKRHLAVGGKYLDIFAIPDRWQSWILTGFACGLYSIIKNKPRIIYSTYPIPSAHCIGWLLHRVTGIPWVADFRDPMAQDTWPESEQERAIYNRIESMVFSSATTIITTTDQTRQYYISKYHWYPPSKIIVIPNGFDEYTLQFTNVTKKHIPIRHGDEKITLLHSGAISIRDRNPINLLYAIRQLLDEGVLAEQTFRLVFRATGNDDAIMPIVNRLGLNTVVSLKQPVSYTDALSEMRTSDGLIVIQGETCNRQIPAKLYEYFYMRKPIFAMLNREGDTFKLLKSIGHSVIVDINDRASVKDGLHRFVSQIKSGCPDLIPGDVVMKYSRRHATRKLAEIFNDAAKPDCNYNI